MTWRDGNLPDPIAVLGIGSIWLADDVEAAWVKPFGVTPSALRADRILDEARQTADPIHLMRLFGICDSTVLKYIFAAHPERQRAVVR